MAPPNQSAYHISLAGQGYIIVDQSYVRRSQLAFTPRFSTGSYGYGDLSFWQFLIQEQWDGGSGQDDFVQLNQIRESNGWDFSGLAKPKRPRLCGGNQVPSGITTPTQVAQNWYDMCQLLRFGRYGNGGQAGAAADLNKIVLIGGGTDFTLTNLRTATANLCGIKQIKGKGGFLFSRTRPGTQEGQYLVVFGATSFQIYDSNFNIVVASAQGGTIVSMKAGMYLDTDNLFLVGNGAYDSGSGSTITFSRVTVGGNNWTLGSPNPGYTGEMPDRVIPHMAVDSHGTAYFAAITEDISSTTFNFASDHIGSAVLIFTAIDMARGGDGPQMSEIVRYPNMVICGLVSIVGEIYLIGSVVNRIGAAAIEYHDVVIKFPNTVIWESRKIKTDTLPKNLPKAVRQINRAEAVFVTESYLGAFDSIMRILPGNVVEEAGAVPHLVNPLTAGQDNGWMAIEQMGNSYYLYDSLNNRFVQYKAQSDLSRNNPAQNCILELSAFGGNTTAITKTLYKVIVELYRTNLPAGETMTVLINEVQFGTLQSTNFTQLDANTYRAEIIAPAEFAAASFVPKIVMPSNSQWTGSIKRIGTQFIPTQLKKHAWGFAIRVEHFQKLLNDQRDQREASQQIADLEAAWKSNTPIDFTDTDGTKYKVIITEISARQPIIATNTRKRENILSMELLEI